MMKYKNQENKNNSKIILEKSSGNVFLDIGFPEDEAINLSARVNLMIQIETIIETYGWTQTQAAKYLKVKQPRISDLINRKTEKFTIDMLMKWLHKLGKEVTIEVKNSEVA